MSGNLLRNGGFEADWAEEGSHRCKVYPTQGQPYEAERGNIFTPPGWTVWFRHGMPVEHDPLNLNGWCQPEVRDAWITGDPQRVRTGQKAILFFTFFRVHDGGFFQQVEVEPGARLRLSAYAHAWSNSHDGPRPDDPRWSDGNGVGYNHFYAQEGTPGLDDGARNFTFWVGIDPTGGLNPYAATVVWGKGAHIYNAHRPVPPVEVTASEGRVTVFLRSRTLWPFKHNDAYWDDVTLKVVTPAPRTQIVADPATPRVGDVVRVTVTSTSAYPAVALEVTDPAGATVAVTEESVEPPTGGMAWRWSLTPAIAGGYHIAFTAGAQRLAQMDLQVEPRPVTVWGLPREQYQRTYVLLPPGAGREWVQAILDSGAWEERRWTIGGSADDAGIGALEDKSVIAINPGRWPADLAAFFQHYYPGTRYTGLEAATPAELRQKLRDLA